MIIMIGGGEGLKEAPLDCYIVESVEKMTKGLIVMNVKDALKKAMKQHNLTQLHVAAVAGFRNQSNIAMILKSGNTMKLENLLKIANAVGCDVIIKDRQTEEEFLID